MSEKSHNTTGQENKMEEYEEIKQRILKKLEKKFNEAGIYGL